MTIVGHPKGGEPAPLDYVELDKVRRNSPQVVAFLFLQQNQRSKTDLLPAGIRAAIDGNVAARPH